MRIAVALVIVALTALRVAHAQDALDETTAGMGAPASMGDAR